MGCWCSKQQGLTTAVQVEIPVAADVVWQVVTDVAALPEMLPFVLSVEMINRSKTTMHNKDDDERYDDRKDNGKKTH